MILLKVHTAILHMTHTIPPLQDSHAIVRLFVRIDVITENPHITEIVEIGTIIVGTGGTITDQIIVVAIEKGEDTQIITRGEIDGYRKTEL